MCNMQVVFSVSQEMRMVGHLYECNTDTQCSWWHLYWMKPWRVARHRLSITIKLLIKHTRLHHWTLNFDRGMVQGWSESCIRLGAYHSDETAFCCKFEYRIDWRSTVQVSLQPLNNNIQLSKTKHSWTSNKHVTHSQSATLRCIRPKCAPEVKAFERSAQNEFEKKCAGADNQTSSPQLQDHRHLVSVPFSQRWLSEWSQYDVWSHVKTQTCLWRCRYVHFTRSQQNVVSMAVHHTRAKQQQVLFFVF